MPFPIATRMAEIPPFHVMEVMKAADGLAEQGRDIIHLSVGEPDFIPFPVQKDIERGCELLFNAVDEIVHEVQRGGASAIRE